MNSIKIYILEDEIITQELLKQTLEDLDFTICGMATNAETALAEIALLKPDIAILDIRVEGSKTGVWLGNQLDIPLIYLTAFNDEETIKKAIATKPTSYLVKPFNNKDLYIAVELAVSKIKKKAQIIVKDKDKKIILLEEQILFAKKEDQYLILYLKDSEKLIRSSIKEFLEQMNSSSFLQVHRSYVINKNCVTAFNSKEITINNSSIPISKTFAKEILEEIS
ncbi:LytR/AlgR family response regulator transcription factor [Salegentibacter salegens]|uniref:Two component transcriptional regulator, LytTR family n=1 Tax=Salegentibacter salegens TaxID=143223 RepID=A0A1M7N284_9FLAO|nr:response regulator transcription factor [Salegentibacter salegens]PRX52364.1 LytTR family two component transcriptional regulator [Salegentibacter salegens]SHM97613.1 two component transcriptional regulator, LytTR family [Salegentibacter salegens]